MLTNKENMTFFWVVNGAPKMAEETPGYIRSMRVFCVYKCREHPANGSLQIHSMRVIVFIDTISI